DGRSNQEGGRSLVGYEQAQARAEARDRQTAGTREVGPGLAIARLISVRAEADPACATLLIETDAVVERVAPDRLVIAVCRPHVPGQDRSGASRRTVHRIHHVKIFRGGDDRCEL